MIAYDTAIPDLAYYARKNINWPTGAGSVYLRLEQLVKVILGLSVNHPHPFLVDKELLEFTQKCYVDPQKVDSAFKSLKIIDPAQVGFTKTYPSQKMDWHRTTENLLAPMGTQAIS